MAVVLRPYQREGVDQIAHAFRGARTVLYVLPTGAGKTVTFCHIADRAALKGSRVVILVHRVELLEQASRALTAAGVHHGVIAAGRSMNLSAQVQVASVQTLVRRMEKLPRDLFQLIIVDEAHHTNAGTWAKVLGHFDRARVLGVTATPCRADGRGLGEWYERMVVGPTPAWLTGQGYLAAARVFCPDLGFDASHLRTRMGDYDMRGASDQLQGMKIMGDAVEHFKRYIGDGTAIVFCCSVGHAEDQAAMYRAAGIAAASIDGSMGTDERRSLLEGLATGRIRALTSCALIGEGVDVPSVTGCQFLRPTKSLALHLQMIGRALRPKGGQSAVILDHVGNYTRPGLGHHLEDREWTLKGVEKAKKATAPSVKECPGCQAALSSVARVCPECGHEFRVQEREIQVVRGSLREMSAEELSRRRRRQEQGRCRTYEELVAYGQRMGRKPGWARHVWAARGR